MAYKIVSSKTFLKRFVALNAYLETQWNLSVAKEFHSTFVQVVLTLTEQPGIGSPSHKKKNVRKILITKHNRLYYRVNDNNTIILLTLFDTRQNPKKNRYD